MTYHHLATRFGRNAHQISGREALDNEALYRHVPSIFASEAHDSRSERYVYVPTIDIVEGLRREGWFPFFAVQAVPRDGGRMGHAKHMLRLRRDDGIGKPEAAEVIIVNSHDGTSAYQMFAGMLRFVCTNSMIAGERFEEVRVPHKGNIQNEIIEGVYTVAEDFPRLIDATETMKETRLSRDEQQVLAEASLVARYGEDESPVRPDQVIMPRRREDVRPAADDPYAAHIAEASQRFGIPERWIRAVLRAESAGDVRAVSSAGAMGLMQVMPDTWAGLRVRHQFGRDPYDPRDNIMAGTAYLREMFDRYGNVAAMLAAYNAGPGRYDEYLATGRTLPAETRAYIAALAPILGGAAASEAPIRQPAPPPDWRDAPLFIVQPNDSRATAAQPSGAQSGDLFASVSERDRR